MRGFPFQWASPVHHEIGLGWTRRVSDVGEICMVARMVPRQPVAAAANKATAAAVAAYPGGIVDRVALLGNGEYNVHLIGVNWPHHVFVSSTFKVVGAE